MSLNCVLMDILMALCLSQRYSHRYSIPFVCPRHDNGRGIKCYPCQSVRTLRTYVHRDRRPLSNSNIFYQNFMKLGHIV